MAERLTAYHHWVNNGCAKSGVGKVETVVDLGYLVDEAGHLDEHTVARVEQVEGVLGKRNIGVFAYGRTRMLAYIPAKRVDEVLPALPEIQPAREDGNLGGYGGWCTHVWRGVA